MKKLFLFFVLALLFVPVVAQGATINGATSVLLLEADITFSNGLAMTFEPGHGANGAYGYVYTDVSGVVQEDGLDGENGWSDSSSYSDSASTSHGSAHGAVTVNMGGFWYDIDADAMVEGLDMGDYGKGMGYAYAWPDWLEVKSAGTATVTLEYSYTLDTTDTCDNAEAYIFMNAFFADHVRANQLTAKDGWTIGPANSNGTTNVEYSDSIQAGNYKTVNNSVSWDIVIGEGEPDTWYSLWAYGEAGVEVAPVPIPAGVLLLASGLLGLIGVRRMRKN